MSRNSSGTYTLPTGNPVVSGTVIEANWANSTLDDISAALTDSLSRSGKGSMSASLRIIDGSVSVPGWAFANETGSGAYRSAAGDWYLTVLGNNIARFRASGVDVTGNLGINGQTLTLENSTAYYPQIINRNKTNDANASYFSFNKDRAGAIVQSGDVLGNLIFSGYDGSSYLQGAYMNAVVSATPGTNDMPTDLAFGTTPDGSSGPSERMRLDKNGNLGVGTSSPGFRIEARTNSSSLLNLYNTTATSNDSVAAQISATNGAYWNYFYHNSSSHRWATYNTERMRLDTNGNLGVGLSPYYKFEVSGSSRLAIDVGNSYTQLRSMNTAGSASVDMYYNAVNHLWLNNGAEKMRLDSSGMLCIATTASGSAGSSGLTIGTGNSIWYPYSGYTTWRTTNYAGGLYFANTGGDKMQITADGTVVMYTAAQLIVGQNSSSTPASSTADIIAGGLNMNTTRRTSGAAGSAVWGSDGWFYRSTSSIRYKKDVEDYGRGLNELMQMRPVSFKSKSETDGDKVFAGFIAEEIDALGMDEYVVRDQDGSPDSIAYANMAAILVKAVQELAARVQQLEAK